MIWQVLCRFALATLAIVALLVGVAAARYGAGPFGQGTYGGALTSSGGGGGGRFNPLPLPVTQDPVPPVLERPAPVLASPTAHALPSTPVAWRPTLIDEMRDVRDALVRDGFSETIATDLITQASLVARDEVSDTDEELLSISDRLSAHADAAYLSRRLLAEVEERKSSRRNSEPLVGLVLAEAENRYADEDRLVSQAQKFFAQGEYERAAALLSGRATQSHDTLSGSSLLSNHGLGVLFVILITGGLVALAGEHMVSKDPEPPVRRTRVSRDVLVTSIVCAVIMSALIGAFLSTWGAAVLADNDRRLDDTAESLAASITLTLLRVEVTADGLGAITGQEIARSGSVDDPSRINGLIPAIAEMTQQLGMMPDASVGAYVVLDPTVFGHVISVWCGDPDGGDGIFVEIPDDDVADPLYLAVGDPRATDTDYLWWYGPLRQHRSLWTPLYVDPDLNLTMISYVGPIFVNGTFVGTYGFDIQFDDIERQIREEDVYSTGFAFLIDDQGQVIVGPADGVVWLADADELLRGEGGSFEIDGWAVAHRRLSTGQRIIVTAPIEEAQGLVGVLRRNFLLLNILLSAIWLGVVWAAVVYARERPPKDPPR